MIHSFEYVAAVRRRRDFSSSLAFFSLSLFSFISLFGAFLLAARTEKVIHSSQQRND